MLRVPNVATLHQQSEKQVLVGIRRAAATSGGTSH